jgi:alpha-tubulin suppressor-like RCC1 family protein
LVLVCGYGGGGQLGVGDNEDSVFPTLVRGELEGRKVLQVAAGGNHTMCLTEDGAVFGFGFNGAGRLGVGDRENRLVPTLLRGELANKSVLQVAAGNSHTIFVTADGLVFSCGLNHKGQLGVGDPGSRLVPTLVTGQLQGETAVYAAVGGFHTLCITADGSLFAWGFNFCGQLGVGDREERRVPTLVTGLQGKQVAHVAAGINHTICTTAEGAVFTGGDGGLGKLGLGDDLSDRLVPTQVRVELLNKAVVQVAAGDQHSACVAKDGSVYSLEDNDHGQLGVTGVGDADLPVVVQELDMNAM